jgi:hypothetical protein
MKISRLGITESTLLIIFWLQYISINELPIIIENQIESLKNILLVWLFTSSGFYDKTLIKDFYNVNLKDYDIAKFTNYNIIDKSNYDELTKYKQELIDNSIFLNYKDTVLINYYLNILEALKNSDILCLSIQKTNNLLNGYIDEFINYLEPKTCSLLDETILYDFIKNKRVLIVSSFSTLMKEQYISGNVKKIYEDFPDVLDIVTINTPYTFFNDGPHDNLIVTCDIIFNKVLNLNDKFDCVIISFGCYSNLLANKIQKKLKKDTLTIGDQLQFMFGILNNRMKTVIKNENCIIDNIELYLTDIPEKYKPFLYQKIENGCYW